MSPVLYAYVCVFQNFHISFFRFWCCRCVCPGRVGGGHPSRPAGGWGRTGVARSLPRRCRCRRRVGRVTLGDAGGHDEMVLVSLKNNEEGKEEVRGEKRLPSAMSCLVLEVSCPRHQADVRKIELGSQGSEQALPLPSSRRFNRATWLVENATFPALIFLARKKKQPPHPRAQNKRQTFELKSHIAHQSSNGYATRGFTGFLTYAF